MILIKMMARDWMIIITKMRDWRMPKHLISLLHFDAEIMRAYKEVAMVN